MTALREFIKVKDHKLEITLPDDFNYENVEVVIMPAKEELDWSYLEKEIDKGIDSGVSNKSHEDIISDIKRKYV